MVIYYFRSMPLAATKCVNKVRAGCPKLGHTTLCNGKGEFGVKIGYDVMSSNKIGMKIRGE